MFHSSHKRFSNVHMDPLPLLLLLLHFMKRNWGEGEKGGCEQVNCDKKDFASKTVFSCDLLGFFIAHSIYHFFSFHGDVDARPRVNY